MSAQTDRNRRILFAALAPTLCLLLGLMVGLGLLPTTLDHLTGTPATARVEECQDPDPYDREKTVKCSARWTVDGREVVGTLSGISADDRVEGRSVPVKVRGSSAVPAETPIATLVLEAAAAVLTACALIWLTVAVWRARRAPRQSPEVAAAQAQALEFPMIDLATPAVTKLQSRQSPPGASGPHR